MKCKIYVKYNVISSAFEDILKKKKTKRIVRYIVLISVFWCR